MAFALVYTGEHYVIDVLLGWLYASTIFVAGNRLFDRYEQWRERRAAVDESLRARRSPRADLILGRAHIRAAALIRSAVVAVAARRAVTIAAHTIRLPNDARTFTRLPRPGRRSAHHMTGAVGAQACR